MGAEISEKGTLIVYPENETESYALAAWHTKLPYSTTEVLTSTIKCASLGETKTREEENRLRKTYG